MSQRMLVLGATSKVAQEIARRAAAEHKELLLVARNAERLTTVASDLKARGAARVECICGDLAQVSSHRELVEDITARMPDFDSLLLAYGTLGDQAKAELSAEYAVAELTTNFTSAVSLLTWLTPVLERRRNGTVAVITSVAGDRGRRSNYVYGTAKGALSLFLQGFRAKLFTAGVRVLTIKLGPVTTPMTVHMKQTRLFSTPEAVAKTIFREMEIGSRDVVYVPGYWRWVMLGIANMPERIAKKLTF